MDLAWLWWLLLGLVGLVYLGLVATLARVIWRDRASAPPSGDPVRDARLVRVAATLGVVTALILLALLAVTLR